MDYRVGLPRPRMACEIQSWRGGGKKAARKGAFQPISVRSMLTKSRQLTWPLRTWRAI